MSCTGIPVTELEFPPQARVFNKTTRLVNMAFEMLKFIDKFKTGKSLTVHLKIGIHEGEVIAGLVGLHKPQFSLIGDTVNTTSRICANGHRGKITISEQAKKELDLLNFVLEEREVEAKGKGLLKIFEVKRRVAGEGGPKIKRVVEKVLILGRERRRNQNFQKIVNLLKRNSEILRLETIEKKNLDAKISKMSAKDITKRIFEEIKGLRGIFWKVFSLKRMILRFFEGIRWKKKVQNTQRIFPKSQLINFKVLEQHSSYNVLKEKREISMKKVDAFTLKTDKLYTNEEFLRQLALKNWKIEKNILSCFFLVMFIRVFLLLSLMNFFDHVYFFIIECVFIILCASLLFFLREFYSNIPKLAYYKYLLVSIYIVGVTMSFLEVMQSNLQEIFCISMVTMSLLHIVITTIW